MEKLAQRDRTAVAIRTMEVLDHEANGGMTPYVPGEVVDRHATAKKVAKGTAKAVAKAVGYTALYTGKGLWTVARYILVGRPTRRITVTVEDSGSAAGESAALLIFAVLLMLFIVGLGAS